MRKYLLLLCLFTLPLISSGAVLTFDQADLLNFQLLNQSGFVVYSNGPATSYIDNTPMMGEVGFTVSVVTVTPNPSLTYGIADIDLASYDSYALNLYNDDNNDLWSVAIFAQNQNGSTVVTSGFVALPAGASSTLSIDISTLGANSIAGLIISTDMTDAGHISASPIPEPATIALFGLGSAALLLKRKKHKP